MGIKNNSFIKIVNNKTKQMKPEQTILKKDVKKENYILFEEIKNNNYDDIFENNDFDFVSKEYLLSEINSFINKKNNKEELKLKDHYRYSKPKDNRDLYKSLHYMIRHYNQTSQENHFPVSLEVDKDEDNYKIVIEAKEYHGSNPGIGHQMIIKKDRHILGRFFFYRFGDIRVDLAEENGNIVLTEEGIDLFNDFVKFYYTECKKGRILPWKKHHTKII